MKCSVWSGLGLVLVCSWGRGRNPCRCRSWSCRVLSCLLSGLSLLCLFLPYLVFSCLVLSDLLVVVLFSPFFILPHPPATPRRTSYRRSKIHPRQNLDVSKTHPRQPTPAKSLVCHVDFTETYRVLCPSARSWRIDPTVVT